MFVYLSFHQNDGGGEKEKNRTYYIQFLSLNQTVFQFGIYFNGYKSLHRAHLRGKWFWTMRPFLILSIPRSYLKSSDFLGIFS